MKIRPTVLVSIVLLLGLHSAAETQESRPKRKGGSDVTWKVGELVPDVTLRGSDGKDHRLRDLVGKRAFVIAWFPKAFTGG